ncbi:serine protein kinase [Vibrio ishigakensis]|uniref:Serine protein kinase n=1 Tax=Vibrio ishigakensis TaxID=1481914 RepID=A0A0B8P7G5_9VIBR|nr:serine protein kinase [Vibrio ishigakensis]
MSIFDHFQARYEASKEEELSIQEFLTLCREDKMLMPILRSDCFMPSVNLS